jgi:hypothetical protein
VLHTVQNSMKGQAEQLIERAVLQARREADLLYNLVVGANGEVIENRAQREREYMFLLGYLSAEIQEQSFLLFKSNSGEASDNVADP